MFGKPLSIAESRLIGSHVVILARLTNVPSSRQNMPHGANPNCPNCAKDGFNLRAFQQTYPNLTQLGLFPAHASGLHVLNDKNISFWIFWYLSDRIKFDQIWRAGLTLVASVLPWHFEPSVLTPRSKEAPAHNWRWLQWNVPFRLQGSHVSVCTSAMRQQSSPKNEVLHEPASVMTWTCSPLAFYTYI